MDDSQHTAQLCASIEKCLQHLRLLKSSVLVAHKTLAGKSVTESTENESLNFEKLKENIEKNAQQISTEYE